MPRVAAHLLMETGTKNKGQLSQKRIAKLEKGIQIIEPQHTVTEFFMKLQHTEWKKKTQNTEMSWNPGVTGNKNRQQKNK